MLFFHILGVILLLGNAMTAAFWKLRADREQDMVYSLRVARGIMAADYLFTLPSIALILITGHVMAAANGYAVFAWSWLGLSYGLFVLSGAIWMAVLLPAQIRMIRQAEASVRLGKWTEGYKKASLVWNVFGTISTLAPVAALVLMALKPDL
ncbi:DUF2269 family protein [Paenibacillus athensensis]|uniref:DUF2269 family protein n=1 Tax=Paenibacillus athensensis TaxID=1967502 RepID=A0A4Y8PZM7_9BACL|nr:DUF2269 family protein [Paenibacillus athensensis]MCD1258576.1 DUF2269 family protein [Paenibacillus athensensis]